MVVKASELLLLKLRPLPHAPVLFMKFRCCSIHFSVATPGRRWVGSRVQAEKQFCSVLPWVDKKATAAIADDNGLATDRQWAEQSRGTGPECQHIPVPGRRSSVAVHFQNSFTTELSILTIALCCFPQTNNGMVSSIDFYLLAVVTGVGLAQSIQ